MNTLHKKCPQCKRNRTFKVPPDHQFAAGHEWQKRDGQWVCCWCVARETPEGEAILRQELKELRADRKERKRKFANTSVV